MLFDPVNWPYWILLGMGVLLFLIVIAVGGGDDDLDLDSGGQGWLDLDADGEIDSDGDFGALQILGWLGLGKAPLMLLLASDLSLWGISGWMLNVALGEVWPRSPRWFDSLILLISLAIALFLGNLIARPLGKVFASFGEDTSGDRLIGCLGTVSSADIPHQHQNRIGQVDILDPSRNYITVSATLPDWATATPKRRDWVLVIDRGSQGYLVILKDSPDQDHWMTLSAPSPHSKA